MEGRQYLDNARSYVQLARGWNLGRLPYATTLTLSNSWLGAGTVEGPRFRGDVTGVERESN